jgi:hypothetical protein
LNAAGFETLFFCLSQRDDLNQTIYSLRNDIFSVEIFGPASFLGSCIRFATRLGGSFCFAVGLEPLRRCRQRRTSGFRWIRSCSLH